MRKLLNTLYITSKEYYLSKEGENVVILEGTQVKFRVPIHNIEGIVSFGYCGASPSLMGFCAEKGVSITFLSPYGRYLASVNGPQKGNILLRKEQYRISDSDERSSQIARNMIIAKIANSRNILMRAKRDYVELLEDEELIDTIGYLGYQLQKATKDLSLDVIRGIEGDVARKYFSMFNKLILSNKDDFYFSERTRRPPKDNINALLSFIYALLAHEVKGALETVGLDSSAGFLHRDRPGRPSLALDMMEELRAYLADRLVLSIVNRKQVNGKGFTQKEGGGVIMEDDTRKIVLEAWQSRKRETIIHPFLNEKIEIGLLPYVQAMLLSRFIRKDIDGYPPFFVR